MTNKNKESSKKKLFFTIFTLVIILLIAGGFIYKRSTKEATIISGVETINYEAATNEEKKQADDTKDEIVKQQEAQQNKPTTPSTEKVAVKPTITNTTGSINAYVSGIFEEGGICTATFTKDGVTLSKTSSGFQNVSYTQCAPINLDPGYLSQGSWSVTVKYSSDKSEGVSDSRTIEVK